MCGIVGIYDRHLADLSSLSAMLEAIDHRGPDDFGVYHDGPFYFGMRRLSIIDIHSGKQPIFNAAGDKVIVFNGEIYNYLELREWLISKGYQFQTKSDTEVILHLYEEKGIDFLHDLNGMFAIAIYDIKTKKLLLARDRLGIKPLYYSKTDQGGLLFASEMKSILSVLPEQPTLSRSAFLHYLSLSYIPFDETPFESITKLSPGHYLEYDGENTTITQYWMIDDAMAPTSLSFEESKQQLRKLLTDAVDIRMRGELPVGAFLSGGMDSSIICLLASQNAGPLLQTFSMGFHEAVVNELPDAKRMSDLLNTVHHELMVTPEQGDLALLKKICWYLDEPVGDTSILPTYWISKFARNHLKVVLSGLGGDELFAGYHRYSSHVGNVEPLTKLPIWMHPLIRCGLALKPSALKTFDRYLTQSEWETYCGRVAQTSPDVMRFLNTDMVMESVKDVFSRLESRYGMVEGVNQRLLIDMQTYLPGQLLTMTDRLSMGASIEARVPFLDHRLVEFSASLPSEWKLHGNIPKYILRETFKSDIPRSILNKPKWGFVSPIQRWFRGKWFNQVQDQLMDSSLIDHGFVTKQGMSNILSSPQSVQSHWKTIWMLLVYELWNQSVSSRISSIHNDSPND